MQGCTAIFGDIKVADFASRLETVFAGEGR